MITKEKNYKSHYLTQYNIYYGTIGKTLGCKYRCTILSKNEQEANKIARNYAESLGVKIKTNNEVKKIDDTKILKIAP